MEIESLGIVAKNPKSFDENEIDDFINFVLEGGEVMEFGLRERVRDAAYLAFVRSNERLLGVGGLKVPVDRYRKRIEEKAGVKLPTNIFPYELGWIYVHPSARGLGLSGVVCRALVDSSDGQGIFATSRTDNVPMHRTMTKLEFRHVGKEWSSKENKATLALFKKAV